MQERVKRKKEMRLGGYSMQKNRDWDVVEMVLRIKKDVNKHE
jgi:hypothetical protein